MVTSKEKPLKIAVTGGAGFFGRATIEAAENAGHDVWAFDRTQGLDILGSLDALGDADTVIHLAGVLGTSELFDMPETAIHVNVIGTLRVLEWCRDHGARYVGVSMPDPFPSVYTATKVAARRLTTAWHHAYDLPVSTVRAFNGYGPYQHYGPGHPQKILPTFARAAWEGRPLPIWGDGEQAMDLVHADDVGRMLVEAAGFGDDETFDAGTGVAVTVGELAEFVLKETGSKAGVEFLPMRPGEVPVQITAGGEGWDRLDWKPEFDWDRVAETVRWYRNAR
jgi:UDP-glucose 4-epimerase